MPLSYDDLAHFYTEHLINSTPKPLTFKPDKEMGEGTPEPEELKYRQELLDLANRLFKVIGKRFKSITNPNDLIKKLDGDINDAILEGQNIILKTLPNTWNDSVNNGIKVLKRLNSKESYDKSQINTDSKDLIIQQQQMNIEDIFLKLRGRLRQRININAIYKNDKAPSHLANSLTNTVGYPKNWTPCMIETYKANPTLSEEELRDLCSDRDWETDFQDVQSNLDKMGLFGWLTTNHLAFYSALLFGSVIIGEIIADWVSQGDDRVCDECLEREAGSPYSIFDSIWTDIPHFGCRCWMDNIRLRSEVRDEVI